MPDYEWEPKVTYSKIPQVPGFDINYTNSIEKGKHLTHCPPIRISVIWMCWLYYIADIKFNDFIWMSHFYEFRMGLFATCRKWYFLTNPKLPVCLAFFQWQHNLSIPSFTLSLFHILKIGMILHRSYLLINQEIVFFSELPSKTIWIFLGLMTLHDWYSFNKDKRCPFS